MTDSDDLLSVNKSNRKIKRSLQAIVDDPANRTCADCPEGDPRWVSISVALPGDESKQLAVLCCSQCKSLHQELGEQVCRVKSVKALEQWTEADVEALERAGGNAKVNKVYESKLTASVYNKQVVLEDPTQDAAARLEFIRQKYQDKAYFDTELYLALLEDAVSRSKLAFRRSHTHDGSRGTSPAHRLPTKSLSGDPGQDPRRKPRRKARSFRGGLSSDESDTMSYSLPSHLGPGSTRHSTQSSRSKGAASVKTRRGRRKTVGDKEGVANGLTSSSSSPCMSRWNSSTPTNAKQERWNNESAGKNFSWDSQNSNTSESRFKDITALRDSLGNNGFKPRAPQRVLSDDSGDDNSRHDKLSSLPLRRPCRVLSDDDDSSRFDRATPTGAPLRMPRRVVSDDSGGEDTDRSERTMPTMDPQSLLVRRRSLPSLNINAKNDEDSIRNQYGGPNFVYSGHKERTAGSKADKPAPKYGIKLKYGFDSATDTDSERKTRRTKSNELERPKDEQLEVPTLGSLLSARPEAPSRILGGRSGAATSDEEDVVAADTTGSKPRRKQRRSRSHSRLLPKKGELARHLSEGKKSEIENPVKSVVLSGLQKIASDVSLSGFSFQSGTDDDISLVRPKTLHKRRSCGGLGLALDDSTFSLFSRASIESNPACH